MRRALALVGLVACGARTPPAVQLPPPGAAQAYPIRLDRPAHRGDRARVLLTGDDDTLETVRRGSEVLRSTQDRKSAKLRATSVVLEVSARGQPTRIAYEDAVLDYERADRRDVLVQHGRIELTRAPDAADARITVDGAPATREVRDALDLLVTFRGGGPTDDDIFGTPTPQPIGGRWAIHVDRARADLASAEDLRAGSIAGAAWLERAERVDGVDCLDVGAHLVLDGIDVPEAKRGARVEVARATASFSGAFPVDAALPRLRERTVYEMTLKVDTPTSGGDLEVEMESASHRDGRYGPLGLSGPRPAGASR